MEILGADAVRHEKAHQHIYIKYGIDSVLLLRGKTPFVMDTNFQEVAIARKLDKDEVIHILSEMLFEPFRTRIPNRENDPIFHYLFDLPCYEVLQKNIREISLIEFQSALGKYS